MSAPNMESVAEIAFIAAEEGDILLNAECGKTLARSSDPAVLAKAIKKHGLRDPCFPLSSIEFSEEHGFPNGDASEYFQEAYEQSTNPSFYDSYNCGS